LDVTVSLGDHVVALDVADLKGASLTTASGKSFTIVLVTGEDGLWSQCRKTFLKNPP
jgi:hypothetical protein